MKSKDVSTLGGAIVFLVLLLFSANVNSQEFSAYLSGGVSGIKYSGNKQSNINEGGNIGVSYAHPLIKGLDFMMGLELGTHKNRLFLKDQKQSKDLVDDVRSAFNYNVSLANYREDAKFSSFNIPFMLRYKFVSKYSFYVALGAKVFIPKTQSIDITAKEVHTSAYYPDFNLFVDDLPQHGFGKRDFIKTSLENELNIAYSLTGETGLAFGFDKSSLYLGFCFDYGLNEIRKNVETSHSKSKMFLDYSPYGMENSQLNTSLKMSPSDFAKIFSLGLRIRYAFSLKSRVVNRAGCYHSI